MRLHITLFALLFIAATGASMAQEEETPRFRTVPWAIIAGAGTDFDSYSLTIAARRGPWGLGFGYRHNTKDPLPAFSTDTPPAGVGGDESFQVSTVGIDLYTSTPIADIINGYATIGGYAKINTVLVKDPTTSQYYRSPNSPDWTGASVAYGAGFELNPFDWMIVGLGYHSIRGFNLHLGYTW